MKNSIQRLFQLQARRTPDAVALVDAGRPGVCLAYSQLNARANQLAHYLRRLGVGPESLVGVCVERSIDMVIGLLGVLKAGAAYVALDPSYPAERLAFMLEDSQATVLLTKTRWLQKLNGVKGNCICLDTDAELLAEQGTDDLPDQVCDLAYIIYTSGSTGRPKGVMGLHSSTINRLEWMWRTYPFQNGEVCCQKTALSFVDSIWEIFGPLLQGVPLVIIPDEAVKDAQQLVYALGEQRVTRIVLVPSLLRLILDLAPDLQRRLPDLMIWVCSGEALPPDLVERFYQQLPDRILLNLYGSSEAAADATWYDTQEDRSPAVVPIGQPIDNIQAYILDANLQLLPAGEVGELYIGGIGLARGYLGRSDLTAERFLPDPFSETPGGRLYKTGDLARHAEDGNILFVGRADHQVKIRGFRIELGEIEATLRQYPPVQQAVVLAREDQPGDKRLAAYLVPGVGQEIDLGELRRYLQTRLPDYMLPSAVVILDAFPLTPNGKIDRLALPVPATARPDGLGEYVAPHTSLEARLAGLWAELLGLEQVGIEDDFFLSGGHSLLAARLISMIRDVFEVELPLRCIFEMGTVAKIAAQIENLRGSPAAAGTEAPIQPVSRMEYLPLSYAQQRLWFLNQLEPDNPRYNEIVAFRLAGRLDINAFERSLFLILERHEALRTSFQEIDGLPRQVISPLNDSFKLRQVDFTSLVGETEGDREDWLAELLSEESRLPFDLKHGPVVRASLWHLNEYEHVFLWVVHHIAWDEWSVGIFVRELSAHYAAQVSAAHGALPDLNIQYADFAAWQRGWLSGGRLTVDLAYWKAQLSGELPVLELPTDRLRPAVQTFHGANFTFEIPAAIVDDFKRLSRSEGVTLFMALLAVFDVLLYRYSGQTDILVSTPVAGRSRSQMEPLIGFFVNTLLLRVDLSGNPTFRELLQRVRETCLDGFAHQDLPFEELVELLHPERDLSRQPLFQVMLALQNVLPEELVLPGLDVRQQPVQVGISRFDLTVFVLESERGLTGTLEYNTDLFDPGTMERLGKHLTHLLAAVSAQPERHISSLPVLGEGEKRQILETWNKTQKSYPLIEGVVDLFETQVEQSPEAAAVVFEDTSLTYKELNARANQLANYLRRLGVRPGILVGICMQRSLEMVVGIFGTLKAGGAYVPLDPNYPADRLNFMVGDAQAKVVLTQPEWARQFSNTSAEMVVFDSVWSEIELESAENLVAGAVGRDPAYVIYTSGSTGRPKGAIIPNQALCNHMQWLLDAFPMQEHDRVLQKTPISFDASVWEFYAPLLTGGQLVMALPDGHRDAAYLVKTIQECQITVIQVVPTLLGMLADEPGFERCTSLKRIFCGGEALSVELARRVLAALENVELINLYGPSEACIDTTYWVCPRDREITMLPIGQPIANVQVYLLDQDFLPVPVGVAGELCIGGVCLAQAYHNRPDLTAEKFFPHPFGNPGERLYRTGDLAKYLPNGDIVYLGRIDFQVKLRGQRIELEEIENVLRQHPDIKECVVNIWRPEMGDEVLAAYLLPETEAFLDIEQLRNFLRGRLPAYMAPTYYVLLDHFPLLPNGKLNRKALPAPDTTSLLSGESYTAPRGPVETTLAQIWRDVLKVERVGVYDNFFEIGGHSLLATRLLARVRSTFQVNLALRSLFEAPTIEKFARLLGEQDMALSGDISVGSPARQPERVSIPRSNLRGFVPLSSAQQRLWFLDQLEPGKPLYNICTAIHLQGRLAAGLLERSLNDLIARHDILRTTFAVMADGQPVQITAPVLKLKLSLIDLTTLPEAERQQRLEAIKMQEARWSFDLGRGPLLRGTLLKLSETEHLFLLTIHHILTDGWSNDILFRELAAFYAANQQGKPADLPELSIQYADYAAWQREWLSGEALDVQLSYWRAQLGGDLPVAALPGDHPRSADQSNDGGIYTFELPRHLLNALANLGQKESATLFMTLLAVFKMLLYRYTNQVDLLVGTPVANRGWQEIEGLVGLFVNTLVLRVDLSGNPTFRDLLRRVRSTALDAYAHQDLPFDRLVEVLQPERSLSFSPLFQVMFVLQNALPEPLEPGDLSCSIEDVFNGAAKFDLTFFMTETENGLTGMIEYRTALFEAATIKRMAGHFQMLLEEAVSSPDSRLSDYMMLTPQERQQILFDWNQTRAEYTKPESILELFERQVELSPGASAVVFEEQQLTYRELNRQANRLAHYLRTLGVGPEALVGLVMERSVDAIVCILGILKAGGAYVPLNPVLPGALLAKMIEDAHPLVLLVEDDFHISLPQGKPGVISMGEIRRIFDPRSDVDDDQSTALALPQSLAYVLFTSGSTGIPKGVAVEHRQLVNYVQAVVERLELSPGGQFALISTLSADLGNTAIYPTLCSGGCLHIISQERALDADALADYFRQYDVDALKIVPSHMTALLQAANPVLPRQQVVLGGEAATWELVSRLHKLAPQCQVVNHYGPTETTVGVTTYLTRRISHNGSKTVVYRHADSSQTVPLGRPLANIRTYILDEHFQPVPVGVPGYLYIGGRGVTRGYLHNPVLTAEKFIPDPFGEEPGGRLYSTGDRARYLADGNIEYLGRMDNQVKVRGFRIELEGIAAVLETFPGIEDVVVLALPLRQGADEKQVVAYYAAAETAEISGNDLSDFCQQKLPDYMTPAVFIQLDKIPLTPNGKVDRKALPDPDVHVSAGAEDYLAPRSALEKMIADMWGESLHLDRVGLRDDFFALGGHSLLATVLVSRLRSALGLNLPLRILFEAPSIERLAKRIEALQDAAGGLDQPESDLMEEGEL